MIKGLIIFVQSTILFVIGAVVSFIVGAVAAVALLAYGSAKGYVKFDFTSNKDEESEVEESVA